MKRLGGIANKERWVGGESKGDIVTLTVAPTYSDIVSGNPIHL